MKPTAFISYSWDSEDHRNWVEQLAAVLESNDIECKMDKFETFPGSDLEAFMNKGIEESEFVLCVCSDGYLAKTNDPTTGVGKESAIIQNLRKTNKAIPIIKNNHTRALPDFLASLFYCDLSHLDVFYDKSTRELQQFMTLLRVLHGRQEDIASPTIPSTNPFDTTVAIDRLIETKIKQSAYINPAFKGKVKFNYSNNGGSFLLGTGNYVFDTDWSSASNYSIHAYMDRVRAIALIESLDNIDNIETTEELDFTSRARTPKVGDAIVWINKWGHMAVTRILEVKARSHGSAHDELFFEYEIWNAPR